MELTIFIIFLIVVWILLLWYHIVAQLGQVVTQLNRIEDRVDYLGNPKGASEEPSEARPNHERDS